YANDSAGNWNESETYSYITTYNPYLTGCSVLDQEGATYYLSSDIEDSSAIGCINITRKNIILDCKNHVIDGVFEFETVGIVVNYTDDDANTNVTIKNCNVKDWFIGIVLLGENNVVINSTLNFNNVSGILIQNGHYNKIINVTSNNNTYTGIFISDNSSHNTIIKSVTNGNNVTGICINNGSTYNTILSSISNENNQSSILIYDAHNNQIIDSNFEDNYYGIWILNSTNNSLISSNSSSEFLSLYLFNSTNNTIAKSTFKSNVVGIILYKSSKNTFINNLIEENLFGVYLEECTECDEYTVDNLFYNNLFKNEINVEFCNFNSTLDCTETFSKNFWNTTKQPGTRIYSPGDQIGGNYWTNLDDNGYSDTCSDNNKDGFCDLPHVLDPDLAGNNIDYYALSDEYGVPSPPSPRSGGGGGPGAPQTTVTTTPGKAIISIPLIAAMSKANVSIQKTEGVDFTQIVISVRNRVTSVQINITKLDAKPEEVPALVNVYRYIRVDKKNIHDENITEVKLRFRVRKSWINSNNIRVDSITLYRFTYTWEKLNTLKIGEDSEDIYFEASSPGLSYFAIAGEKSKQNCTYECCVGEEEYYDKPCTSGYKCENHVCVPITVPCTEDWVCTEWSECIEGKQTRVCTDKNKCGTVANKPEEERACEEKLPTLVFWLGIVIVLLFIFLVAKMVVKKVKPKEKPKLKEKR
ncbi:MAG: NosD domain-containing protein, partial [Candidatus Aenigmatarchaeota archaeon]